MGEVSVRRELFHLYGPFSIQSYGLAIIIGLACFSWFVLRHPKRASLISTDQYTSMLLYSIVTASIGGRILYALYNWQSMQWFEIISLHQGGFSVLGSILALCVMLPAYFYVQKIPIIPMLDLLGTHAPLLQAIARLGCFAAGCCFGKPTTFSWGIYYTDPLSYAPLYAHLHPTQLYSALLLFILFLLLYLFLQHKKLLPGTLFCAYLLGASLERFIIDFFRADQEILPNGLQLLSLHQYLALALFIFAGSFAFLLQLHSRKEKSIL